jgi:cytochrome c553
MSDEWIIDVLTDLKAYAEKNGLHVTADQLDDARFVAVAEIASASRQQTESTNTNEAPVRGPSLYVASGDYA